MLVIDIFYFQMDLDKKFSDCKVYVDEEGDLYLCDGHLVIEDATNGNFCLNPKLYCVHIGNLNTIRRSFSEQPPPSPL